MTEEQIIEDILDEFDFDKVHKVMEFLNWTWVSRESPNIPPTVGQLRKKARSLMLYCLNKGDQSIATGGFWVTKRILGGTPFYRLQFVVSSWENIE